MRLCLLFLILVSCGSERGRTIVINRDPSIVGSKTISTLAVKILQKVVMHRIVSFEDPTKPVSNNPNAQLEQYVEVTATFDTGQEHGYIKLNDVTNKGYVYLSPPNIQERDLRMDPEIYRNKDITGMKIRVTEQHITTDPITIFAKFEILYPGALPQVVLFRLLFQEGRTDYWIK